MFRALQLPHERDKAPLCASSARSMFEVQFHCFFYEVVVLCGSKVSIQRA
jgi:hypothetical protein